MSIAPNSLFGLYFRDSSRTGCRLDDADHLRDLNLDFLGTRLKIVPDQVKLAKLVRRGKGSLSAKVKETLVQVSARKNSMDMRSL